MLTCLECRVCRVLNLFFNFWFLLGYFLSIFDPKNLSKINQKNVNFWAQFLIFLLGVLELFGFFLGAFLGLLRLSWEASGPKNLQKREVFWGFWKCSFLVLWSSWWLSWAHLAPSLADLVPKWAPKWFPKVVQKVIKKLVKNDTKNDQKVTKKFGPKSGSF